MSTFRVTNSPSNAWATTNLVAVNPRDFDSQINYIILNDLYIFSVKWVYPNSSLSALSPLFVLNLFPKRSDDSIPARNLGLNAFQRRWGSFSLNEEISVQPFDPINALGANAYLGTLTLEVGFFRKFVDESKQFDTDEMARIFCQVWSPVLHEHAHLFRRKLFANPLIIRRSITKY